MNSLANSYNQIRAISLRREIEFLKGKYLSEEDLEDITGESDLLISLQDREIHLKERIVD